jgi:putrescine:ornithine antiporter
VTLDDRFGAVQRGEVDLLCGADTRTLGRMKEVAFSIPIFPGGIGALVRTDAAPRLVEILSGAPHSRPNWRAEAGQLLQTQTFAVVPGTTAEPWLAAKTKEFQLTSKVTPVDRYDAGVSAVLARKANVFFADRAILLDATQRNSAGKDLVVINRLFTYEPVALAFARGDADFRLVVDRTLSRLYSSPDFKTLYGASFGSLDENSLTFFRWNILPE